MPTLRMENGSTISTIDAPEIANSPQLSVDDNGIYATSRSGERMIRWDTCPRTFVS